MDWIMQGKAAIAATCGDVMRSSAIYETAAWGREDQDPFLNAALEVRTALPPEALLAAVNDIEHKLGRRRDEQWGSRTLDIDILFYEDRVIDLPHLKVPHQHLPERRFALVPLCEIAPQLLHPQSGKTIQQLLDDCRDPLPVRIFLQAF